MATRDIPLTPIDSRATTNRTTEASESGILNNAEPAPGTRVVEALDSYPDGGTEAWMQVFACSCLCAVSVGGIYSWGVLQKGLVGLASTSTISYIGSCQAAMTSFCAIIVNRLIAAYGPRYIALIGATLCTLGPILAGWCTGNFPALFVTEGLLFGIGQSCLFFAAATLPSSYFLKKRNLATGASYAGGGIGGAAFSLISTVLIDKVGVAWTLRANGLMFAAISFPAALYIKSRLPRKPLRSGPVVDWSLFKDPRFCLILAGGSIGLFPLFVPPFFLPLYAGSLGLSSITGSLLLAGFNLASAMGRVGFGVFADKVSGSVNALILCLASVGVSTLVLWPISTSVVPLAFFAVVNGCCAGGFFSLMPGVISSLFGSSKLSVTFGMVVSSWAPGYFLGAPIAGFILTAFGGSDAGYAAFRPAIFYSGAMSVVSCALVIGARLRETTDLKKKL